MNAEQLAKAAVKTGRDARDYASLHVQRELALARCAMHIYWCDDPALLTEAAQTARAAINLIILGGDFDS
jgi:hypothetical protein